MTARGRQQLWVAHADASVWTCDLITTDPYLFVELKRDGRTIMGQRFTTRAAAEQWAREERSRLGLD